jgi:hypothetical protein
MCLAPVQARGDPIHRIENGSDRMDAVITNCILENERKTTMSETDLNRRQMLAMLAGVPAAMSMMTTTASANE